MPTDKLYIFLCTLTDAFHAKLTLSYPFNWRQLYQQPLIIQYSYKREKSLDCSRKTAPGQLVCILHKALKCLYYEWVEGFLKQNKQFYVVWLAATLWGSLLILPFLIKNPHLQDGCGDKMYEAVGSISRNPFIDHKFRSSLR